MKKIIVCLLILLPFTKSSEATGDAHSSGRPVVSLEVNYSDTLNKIQVSATAIENAEAIESKTKEHFRYAIRFNFPVELIEDLPLFRFIDEWYGVRYRFGGTTKNGIDCSAFTQRLVKDVYCINLHRVVAPQYRQCEPVAKEDMIQGDLVFFETFQPGLSHVGVYLGDNKFVHASSNKGITIDDLDNSYYKRTYRKSGRIIGKP